MLLSSIGKLLSNLKCKSNDECNRNLVWTRSVREGFLEEASLVHWRTHFSEDDLCFEGSDKVGTPWHSASVLACSPVDFSCV